MRYKRKLIVVGSLLLLVVLLQLIIPGNAGVEAWYSRFIFLPYQSFRGFVFGGVPMSVGDILYIVGFFALIAVTIRWLYFIIRIRSHKHFLAHSALNTGAVLAVVYILFFIGWGGNYYKPPLVKYWALNTGTNNNDSILATYDAYLIARLNALAPACTELPFKQVNARAEQYFRQLTNSGSHSGGLTVKPSVFGYFMQYMGIQGYYNPFTGEAQVNRFLPSFMLPFVTCHEMAHQRGIAAEDDANLVAYAVCVRSPDRNFSYSGYFNIWLYTHNRLRMADSLTAGKLLSTLNIVSHNQLDTLRAIRKRYRSRINAYSSAMYDEYLKMHNQKNGIDSYYGVVLSAWAWEEQRKTRKDSLILIP